MLEKYENSSLKVKGQGQTSPKSVAACRKRYNTYCYQVTSKSDQ